MELNYVTVGLRIEHSVDDGATLVVFSEKTYMYTTLFHQKLVDDKKMREKNT